MSFTPSQEITNKIRTRSSIGFGKTNDKNEQRILVVKNSYFTGGFTFVRANQTFNTPYNQIELKNYTSSSTTTVDLNQLKTKNLGMYVHFVPGEVKFTKFTAKYNGIVYSELNPVYSIWKQSGNWFEIVPYLQTIGQKSIVVEGWNGLNLISTMTLSFKIIDSSLSPTPSDPLLNGTSWTLTNYSAAPVFQARHEACFVMVGRVAVLLGGRGQRRPGIYDPRNQTWKMGSLPPNVTMLHHFQCVALQNKVWIVAAWTGGYPKEPNAPFIYIYDPFSDKWTTRNPMMPEFRRRGSTAVIAVEPDQIYVAFGSRGGHETGNHATSYAWLDMYNTTSNTWKALPDARYPRDHTGGALMADKKHICVAGGRDGGTLNWPVVLPTECYDITTKKWTVHANIPGGGRGGSSYGRSCDGRLIVAGGEVWNPPSAVNRVDVFNGTSWVTIPNLKQGRHSTGVAVDCACRALYIASGSGSAGGSPELHTMETLSFAGGLKRC